MKRIVIIGGGFAGVFAARRLRRILPSQGFEIELFSDRNYFVFQPLLPEVAAGTINSEDAVASLRSLLPGVHVREASVIAVDFDRQEINYVHGMRRRALKTRYDHLILAGGQASRLERFPGFESHSLAMRDLSDAYLLRNHVIGCLELADTTQIEAVRKEALTFVVAGGGFSGVETMGEIVEMVRKASRQYPSIDMRQVHFLLIHGGDHLLPEMPRRLGEYACRHLEKYGVDVKLNTRLASASMNKVNLDTIPPIDSRTLVSTIGSGPSSFTESLNLPLKGGRLITDATFRVPGRTNVWALGDIAAVPMADGTWAPPTAQFAIRQAKVLADNLLCAETGRPLIAFQHRPLGMMASLGSYRAVAAIGKFEFCGLFAWLLWRSFYIAVLPGFSTRLRVALNWLFDYFLPRNLVHMSEAKPGGCKKRRYQAGDIIFSKGQFIDGFYAVISGRLKFEGERLDGSLLTKEFGPGEHWGEWIITHGGIITGRLQAVEATEVLVMNTDDYNLLRHSLPGFDRYFSSIDPERYSRHTRQ